jgi:hypothetical protein
MSILSRTFPFVLLLLLSGAAAAAQPNPLAGLVRFDGTVISAGGSRVTLHEAAHGDVTLTLPASPRIMSSQTGSIADLAAGSFVGCTAVRRADRLLHATECHVFPEALRGTGEGHNPMGPPDTTMTNGNIATLTGGRIAAQTGDPGTAGKPVGATLRVTYHGGHQTIHVGPDARITRITQGTPDQLRPGVRVMGAARPAADGSAEVVFLRLTP